MNTDIVCDKTTEKLFHMKYTTISPAVNIRKAKEVRSVMNCVA